MYERNISTHKNIYTSIRPLYRLSQFIGLAPLTMIKEKTTSGHSYLRLEKSKKGIIYTICIIIILILYNCFLSVCMFIKGMDLSAMYYTFTVELFISIPLSIMILAVSMYNICKQMDKVLQKIAFVDKLLITFPGKIYIYSEKLLKMAVFGIFLIITSINFYDIYIWHSNGIWYINFMICVFSTHVYLVILVQFVSFVVLIKHRFKCLNEFLRESENYPVSNRQTKEKLEEIVGIHHPIILKNNILSIDTYDTCWISDINSLSKRSEEDKKYCSEQFGIFRVNTLRMIYDVLCDIASSVNDIYGFQMFLLTIIGFTKLIAYLNYAIISYIQVGVSHKVMNSFLWASLTILTLFSMAGCCNFTSRETLRTAVLIQKLLLLRNIQPETRRELELFVQLVNTRKVKFNAWNFFTIDFSILGSIISAATTYIVIIVQFQKLS